MPSSELELSLELVESLVPGKPVLELSLVLVESLVPGKLVLELSLVLVLSLVPGKLVLELSLVLVLSLMPEKSFPELVLSATEPPPESSAAKEGAAKSEHKIRIATKFFISLPPRSQERAANLKFF